VPWRQYSLQSPEGAFYEICLGRFHDYFPLTWIKIFGISKKKMNDYSFIII